MGTLFGGSMGSGTEAESGGVEGSGTEADGKYSSSPDKSMGNCFAFALAFDAPKSFLKVEGGRDGVKPTCNSSEECPALSAAYFAASSVPWM